MPPSNTNTEIALLKQSMEFTTKEISEVKKILLEFIDSADSRFVKVSELEPIKEKQKLHDEIISRFAWAFVWGFIAIIGAFIGITKFM